MAGKLWVSAAASLGLLAMWTIGPAAAAPVTDEMIANGENDTHNIVTYGIGLRGQRFSKLSSINASNVKDLVPAWSFSFGGEKQHGQQAQPLVVDGVIYTTASYSRLFAVDAKTGRKLWEYDHPLPEGILPCCDVINRGAAIYGDTVYFGTLDSKLVALNRANGKVLWKKTVDDYQAGSSITSAPIIVHGHVIVTPAGGEFGVVGKVVAYDAKTGEEVWSRPFVEGNMGTFHGKESTMTGKRGATWPGDLWKTGGSTAWNGCTYDSDTNLLLCGTGNPSPWNSYNRPGDNLYSASTVAVDADSGEIKWHYQNTPHDGWDFDSMPAIVAFDMNKDGKLVKAAAHFDKNGFFYVYDRTNGQLISATPFVTKVTWASGVDLKTGRPQFIEDNRPGKPKEAGKGASVFTAPSFLGGNNWNPPAYHPDTALWYVPCNEWGMDIWNEPISYKKGAAYLGAGFTIKPLYPDYIGALRAIDPVTGKIVWEQKNPAPLWGGVLATAGNLVFTGTPEGYLKAFDAKTGEELWKFQTGSGITGSPITWEQDGEQYIAVVSGWGGAVPLWGGEVAKIVKDFTQGGSLWVFKLHKS
jgi:alcohol dehydrogenase (cytochrome c)